MATLCYLLKRFPRLSQTFVLNEVLELRRQGLEPDVVARAGGDEDVAHAAARPLLARVRYLPPPGGDDEVVAAIRVLGPSHVHSHFATWGARAAHVAWSQTGVPYSFTAHARDIFGRDVNRAALVERMAAARFVVTVTEHNRRFLERLLRDAGADGRVVRLYNGVDLEALAPRDVTREEDLVVGVGRLIEKKGFADLIDAAAALARARPRLRVALVGDGPQRAALEARVDGQGLEDRVRFLGAQPFEEIARLVSRAAVFALPCVMAADGDVDALPTVILEAMALGTPVVSTAISGIPEMVQDGRTGLLVGERDVPALAAALDRLLGDAAERARFATAARAVVAERFDLRRNVATLRGLFTEALVAA